MIPMGITSWELLGSLLFYSSFTDVEVEECSGISQHHPADKTGISVQL